MVADHPHRNVLLVRQELLGRTVRPVGWWKAPRVQALLRSSVPVPVVAAQLKLTRSTVYALRRRAFGDGAPLSGHRTPS